MTPLPANKALDNFFFEARSRLLDLAAFLDRINRGRDASNVSTDPRLDKIRRALEVPCTTRAAAGRNEFSRFFRWNTIRNGKSPSRGEAGGLPDSADVPATVSDAGPANCSVIGAPGAPVRACLGVHLGEQ